MIAGACTFAAVTDWARFQDRTVWARLGFDDRIPAATTVWRLLIRIDAAVLSQVLARWLRSRAVPAPVAGRWWRLVIAVDGKIVRGARLGDGRQVHLLSAYDTSTGIVLAQVQIDDEVERNPGVHPAAAPVKTVLGSLDGVLLVADALHAQTGHADLLAARRRAPDGHGQRPTSRPCSPSSRPCPGRRSRSVRRPASTGHGRKETRTVKTSTVPPRAAWRFPHAAAGRPDHPHPHDQGQDQPRDGLPDRSLCPPARPSPPIWARGRVLNGRSKTVCITSETSRYAKTRTKPGPATGPPCSPPCVTPRSDTTALNGATNIAEATREANHRPHDLLAAVTTGKPTVTRVNMTLQ